MTGDPRLQPARPGRLLPVVALELAVVGGVLLAYRSARLLVGHSSAAAFVNARALLGWERALPLPDELAVQRLLLTSEPITRLANIYYATVHFPLTGAFLVWLFLRSRDHYYRVRTSLALLTGLALVIHAGFPLAPARMLSGHGFVDTAAVYGPAVYSSPETDSLANQFAAMPSLHFGWAVMVALGVVRVSRSRFRTLWIAHPIITLLVIVGTANHYWLDAGVAGGLIILSEYAVAAWWGDWQVYVFALNSFADWLNSFADWRKASFDPASTARFRATRRRTRTRGPPHRTARRGSRQRRGVGHFIPQLADTPEQVIGVDDERWSYSWPKG